MRDPYLYPDSEVLKNLSDIHNTDLLKNMEADYSTFIRKVVFWNRKEQKEHSVEEIRNYLRKNVSR